ncbi:MAG: hypothetical protein ACD_20C00346G0022 [uncultured bacterium]|nr:MAG: hypothetical protein ACD_20C00346G0022 [uncultured bacterium]HBH17837.1 hypothetical protein [Cyanobacteria bacterium UBA9579]
MADITRLTALSMYNDGQALIDKAQTTRAKLKSMSLREELASWTLKTFPNAWESRGLFLKETALKMYPGLEKDMADFKKPAISQTLLGSLLKKIKTLKIR